MQDHELERRLTEKRRAGDLPFDIRPVQSASLGVRPLDREDLKPADGAIGSHVEAVRAVDQDFTHLASTLAKRMGLRLPA